MTLYSVKTFADGTCLGIWEISEPTEILLKLKQFSDGDKKIIDSFSHEQRKKEWLCSRILTDILLGNNRYEIIYDTYNKPFIKKFNESAKDLRLHISISHSRNLLAIIIGTSETGIDIELIKPKILSIQSKFVSPQEEKLITSEFPEDQLTLFWCVKESLYKLYGKKELIFKKNIIITSGSISNKGIISANLIIGSKKRKFILDYERITFEESNFMLAYVTKEL